MNPNRDIERVLDIWFVDGPSVAPDRLMLAVFDEVERVPQRRLSRLTLRLSEMSPRLRILAAAAAAIIVAVVGFALINRGSIPNIGPSSSPTVGPSFPPSVPAALVGRWQSGTRDTPGIDPGAGTTILIGQGTLAFAQANDIDRPRITSTVNAIGPNELEIQTVESDDCAVNESGRYTWSLSPGGKTLTLTADTDACPNRQNGLVGAWQSERCPIADEGCLGPLEAGEYKSMFFDPFVGPADVWKPRYGVLTYTVSDGWSNVADWPESFNLEPVGGGASLALYAGVVAPSDDGPCSELPSPTIQTAQQVADWLATAPGVAETTPTAVTIGGLDGWQVDLSMDPAWTTPCPAFSQGGPGRITLVDQPAAEGFAWSLVPGQRNRVYLLDLADGRTLLVGIDAPTQAAFDAVLAHAAAIVESFEFVQ